ncbi:nuclear RNA export factor 1 isoform X1 [Tachysurus vachellii]|uniref:nuclear RNA export factor 1 isoform X1 n=1 Tax=Tachysurus vachellii TaxID=175792 RepID=UPI00296A9942|nr:nuclear RNA export factor 1 isoform X1 [Tachysurus vachellii]
MFPHGRRFTLSVVKHSEGLSEVPAVREVWINGRVPEHDDRVGGPHFRNRHGPPRGRVYNVHQRLRGGPTGGFSPGSLGRFVDEDGDVNMNSGQGGAFQRRYNPYGRANRRGEFRIAQDRRGAGRSRPGRGSQLPGNAERQGCPPISGNSKMWYKITIPFGKKYDKRWLLSSLQNLCPFPFTPVHYSMEGQKVQFYVEDGNIASALHNISHRIKDNEGYKVVVIMNPCSPPSFLQNDLKEQDIQHLKQCMSKRFDSSEQFLDLNSIRTDQDLISQNISVILSRKSCMQAVMKIIKENIPQLSALNLSNNKLYKLDDLTELVNIAPNLKTLNLSNNELKSEQELDKLKSLKLTELWLDRNPLCDHFTDQATYISAVCGRFPRLLKLDGHSLPAPIGFDVETRTAVPSCKGSYFVSGEVKQFILHFLNQFYSVYDSGNRQPLLNAYDDGACFSLSLPFTIHNPSKSNLGEYQNHNRNIKRIKDPVTRFRVLKHTRLNVVAFLNELPKTQHDLASFTVDVNTCTQTLLVFTVSGVFKDIDIKSKESTRAFSRVFVAVPAMNNGLCLVNDALFVRNATTEEMRHAFVTPAPTPSSSPVSTHSPTQQQEMISTFSQKFQMNHEWTQKWLQQNDWDFNRAVQLFIELKAQGSISEAAFT